VKIHYIWDTMSAPPADPETKERRLGAGKVDQIEAPTCQKHVAHAAQREIRAPTERLCMEQLEQTCPKRLHAMHWHWDRQ
jgi:hypothetical protein